MNTNRNRRTLEKGFTLLELIVVITIIGLLGTLVVTKVAPMLAKGNATKIKYDLQKIYEASTYFQIATGNWPESIDDMINAVDDDGNDELNASNLREEQEEKDIRLLSFLGTFFRRAN